MRTIGTIIIVIVTTIFCLNVDALPTIGDINSAPNQHITPTYIEDGHEDTGSPNLVTAVWLTTEVSIPWAKHRSCLSQV